MEHNVRSFKGIPWSLDRSAVARHVLMFMCALALTWLFLRAKSGPALVQWNRALADTGFLLLSVSLVLGPLSRLWPRLFRRALLYRRETGIWAGLMALVHVALLAQGRQGWDVRRWFLNATASGYTLNAGAHGFGNLLGMVSVVILMALLVTSNDWSLRRLGAPAWKHVQQYNYALFLLAALHTVVFLYGMNTAGFTQGPGGGSLAGMQHQQPPGMAAQGHLPGGSGGTMQQGGGVSRQHGQPVDTFPAIFWVSTVAAYGFQAAGFVWTVRRARLRNELLT